MKNRIAILVSLLVIVVIVLLIGKCSHNKTEQSLLSNPELNDSTLQKDSTLIDSNSIDTTLVDASPNESNAERNTDSLKVQKTETQAVVKPLVKKTDPQLKRRSIESLQKFIANLAQKPQVFYVSVTGISTVEGIKGTTITFDPAILKDGDGKAPRDSIRVELLEIFNKMDMILNNVSTMSGDSVLISDGMIRLEMYAGGQQLQIQPGNFMEVVFPEGSDDQMQFFNGNIDSTGSPDWMLDETQSGVPEYQYTISAQRIDRYGNPIVSENQSIEEIRSRNLHGVTDETIRRTRRFRIGRMGYFNLDKFLDRFTPRAELVLEYKNDDIKAIKCYVVFKELNSILTEYFYSTPISHSMSGLPTKQHMKLLAIGFNDTIPYYSEQDVYINSFLKHQFAFKQTTEIELQERIRALLKD